MNKNGDKNREYTWNSTKVTKKLKKHSHLYRKTTDVANKKYKSGDGKVMSLQSPILEELSNPLNSDRQTNRLTYRIGTLLQGLNFGSMKAPCHMTCIFYCYVS